MKMPYSVLEKKVSMVKPQFMPELSAFVDFILYRQGECEQSHTRHGGKSFLELLASAKLQDGELDISRSRDVGRTVAL